MAAQALPVALENEVQPPPAGLYPGPPCCGLTQETNCPGLQRSPPTSAAECPQQGRGAQSPHLHKYVAWPAALGSWKTWPWVCVQSVPLSHRAGRYRGTCRAQGTVHPRGAFALQPPSLLHSGDGASVLVATAVLPGCCFGYFVCCQHCCGLNPSLGLYW